MFIEIDIPTLEYLARYTGFKTIFDCIMQLQHSSVIAWSVGLGFSLGPADPTQCSSSLLVAYKRKEVGKLLTF